MKILISHVYSEDNKGDAALLSVLVSDLKAVFGDSAEITILTIDKVVSGHVFEGVPVVNSFMYYALQKKGRIVKLFYSLFVIYYSLLWALIYKQTGKIIHIPKEIYSVTQLYKNCDLVVGVGGGYLRGKPGLVSSIMLMLLLHPFRISKLLGKPTIIYPQSVGPFYGRLQKYLIKKHLKKVDKIMVREDISLRLLQSYGISKNVTRATDGGFAFKSNAVINLREMFKIDVGQIIVGVTVRSWLNYNEQTNYEQEMAKFLNLIINQNKVKVLFIPQVTTEYHKDDDREVNQRVYNLLENKNEAILLNENYSHHQIKAIYGGLDYLVGTRFHSVIFALTSYVPCLAIEYEHKTRGIMTDLGLEEWVVPMSEVSASKLTQLFKKIQSDKNYYLGVLKEKLPPYIIKANESREILKDTWLSKSMPKKLL